jgi:hypothetical protein
MIVQEDVPYTKEEVKAMVKTIHDLREKLSLLGWRPASEHPPVDKETGFSELVVGIMPGDTVGFPQYVRYQKNEFYDRWIYGYTGVPNAINIKWWCYPPEED